MTPYFSYELTLILISLFNDGVMHKTMESQLVKLHTSDFSNSWCNVSTSYVIDGGILLLKINWTKKMAYKDVLLQYV